MPSIAEASVQYLKGVGPGRKKTLANLGVETLEDLLYLFPRRYEDRSKITPIAKAAIGEPVTITGKVLAGGGRKSWFTRKHVQEAIIDDGTGRITAVWFNQPYLANYFKPGVEVVLYGQTAVYKDRIQMVSPEYEILDRADLGLSMGRIVPIYPLTRGISQRYLRKTIRACLDAHSHECFDVLPVLVRNKHRLINIRKALENIHFPESAAMQEEAQRRVAFEEFLLFQLSVFKRRMSVSGRPGTAHQFSEKFLEDFRKLFPFSLTSGQEGAMAEIMTDMRGTSPMLRLLQGDVGCGKTLVAVMGCFAAFSNQKQSAIMAPTEILARQHFAFVSDLIKSAGRANNPFAQARPALLVGSLSSDDRARVLQDIRKGKVDLVIGTHALLSAGVAFKNLSYAVIDEQHKFGVRQRAFLSAKGAHPDVLVMTATPIPRTLSLALFGDLDVSTIRDMPPGRPGIATTVLAMARAPEAYAALRREVEAGRQGYIIYPLVDESEALDLKAALSSFKTLQKTAFKGLKLGLVHGQMKRDEAEVIMRQFKSGEIHILVSTSVVEVGVDVPNATVMVIEHAERFGLAQLHQLRGRVGRGEHKGACYLISDAVTDDARARLAAIASTTDGFRVAEADLQIRGPGQYFGRHQHGLNELRINNPLQQIELLELARAEAREIVRVDPDLAEPANAVLEGVMRKRYPDYLSLATAG